MIDRQGDQSNTPNRSNRSGVDAARHSLSLAGSLAGAALVLVAAAGCTPTATNPEEASVSGTLHVCSSCHGIEGRSISPTFPRLAGQRKEYLEVQLKAFRDKTRADPHASTYMWGMAARLSDATIAGVAEYYSKQQPVAGTPGDPVAIAAGKKIYDEGIPSADVPPCQACHGEQAEGKEIIPRLAGLHRRYLQDQLVNFASNARENEVMHTNAKTLTAEQISALATYLAAQ